MSYRKRNKQSDERKQATKDSSTSRVNFDNERETKFNKEYEKRPSRQPRRSGKKPHSNEGTQRRRTASNEVSWYAKSPELLKASASVPFAAVLGDNVFRDSFFLGKNYRVPGIMSLTYLPLFGDLKTSDSSPNAWSQSFNSMYSFLVHANSRNYTYDAPDLQVITLAGMQCFEIVACMLRAYGTVRAYQEKTLYSPDALLTAMGFSPTSLRENMAQAWFDLNLLINKTKQIWVPNTLPLLSRRIWMNSNLFYDDASYLPQVYLYRPSTFYMYAHNIETGGSGGSCLAQVNDPTVTATTRAWEVGSPIAWSAWVKAANQMLDALLKDEDRGIIYGDILKAYGPEKIFALPPIDASYTTLPVYNPEVLTQIENTVTSRANVPYWLQNAITNKLYPVFTATQKKPTAVDAMPIAAMTPSLAILNFHTDAMPTPEMVMVATRNTAVGMEYVQAKYVDAYGGYTQLPTVTTGDVRLVGSCGTELFVAIHVYVVSNSPSKDLETLYLNYTESNNIGSVMNLSSLKAYLAASAFDWSPFWYTFDKSTVISNLGMASIPEEAYGEYANYTTLPTAVIDKMHTVAKYSLLGVPQI